MLGVRSYGLGRQLGEVGNVAGHEGAPFSRRVGQLGSIVELGVADLVRADRVAMCRAQQLSYTGREVLVKIQLHPARTTRTRPG